MALNESIKIEKKIKKSGRSSTRYFETSKTRIEDLQNYDKQYSNSQVRENYRISRYNESFLYKERCNDKSPCQELVSRIMMKKTSAEGVFAITHAF